MSFPKLGFEETLLERVVSPKRCVGCGACVLVCPFGCLEYFEQQPRLVKKCEVCGICPRACPRYEYSQQDLEQLVFGRKREPTDEFGIYQRLVLSQTTDTNIAPIGQDGGIVTTLVTYAMKNGLIDGALLSGVSRDKPFHPTPVLATTPAEVLRCAGTRYTYSPNLLAIREALEQKRNSLAFVGTPCQIQAIRKMEAAKLRKFTGKIRFAIGLMCTESFTYEGLMEKQVQETLGIKLHDIKKMNIKGKIIVTTYSGDVKTISLAEAKRYTRKSCLSCQDFSAELADISAGGLGLDGWTMTIVRTEAGRELFEAAEKVGVVRTRPVEEAKNSLNLLVKLSKKKRSHTSTLK